MKANIPHINIKHTPNAKSDKTHISMSELRQNGRSHEALASGSLLYVYYATANKNPKKVYAWQDICITLDKEGIFEKQMYQSKEDLKDKSLITENPLYQSGLYRNYANCQKKFKPK